MQRLTENKIVMVVRATRLAGLKARFATKMQAKFYVSRLGGDFTDYEREDSDYQSAISQSQQILAGLGRVQLVQRALLPNFVFGPEDIVVALGQDGLVANTLKYLDGQPLIGVNPDPKRWDGQLLPFTVRDLDNMPALIFALEPVFAWATSYIVAGETLSNRAVAGAILILAGIVLVELKPLSGGEHP